MSTNKHIDKICLVAVIVSLVLCALFMSGSALGIHVSSGTAGYENRLFDSSKVHTVDIVIDDWEAFLETAQSEEYSLCSVVIDGEAISKVGIRGKGNTSLSTVASMNSDRYSFKIEFDQYDSTKSYHGLDKLCLNNLIQDNTYMKDYLSYQMMNAFDVPAPLCSYAYITVNGEAWDLYLAVEAVEESFLQRNYGSNYGELYKPDSMNMGGGRGNGKDFDMSDFMNQQDSSNTTTPSDSELHRTPGDRGNPGGMAMPGNPVSGNNTASASGMAIPGNIPGGFGAGASPLTRKPSEVHLRNWVWIPLFWTALTSKTLQWKPSNPSSLTLTRKPCRASCGLSWKAAICRCRTCRTRKVSAALADAWILAVKLLKPAFRT